MDSARAIAAAHELMQITKYLEARDWEELCALTDDVDSGDKEGLLGVPSPSPRPTPKSFRISSQSWRAFDAT